MPQITESDWSDLFPMEVPRPCQVETINFVLNSLVNDGKKFAVCEVGTGGGKSAIGLTISRYLSQRAPVSNSDLRPGGYFLTTQKVLQDQYVSDFGATMKSVKSSTNYQCSFYEKNTCSESLKLLKTEPKTSKFFGACVRNCVYRAAKDEFLNSHESVTNFPYFITAGAHGKVPGRQVLVVDEAHNISSELSKFIEVSFTERYCRNTLKIDFPPPDVTQFQAVKWVQETYSPKVKENLKAVTETIKKNLGSQDKILDILGLTKTLELLQGHCSKLDVFNEVYDPVNWIMNSVEAIGRSSRKLEFKVIDVGPFTDKYLFRFGGRTVMMSATILGKASFCQSLNLRPEETAYVSVPSPFPVENRPILYVPIGKMGMKNIDETLPRMAEAVKEIIDSHPKEKGIIHAGTYRIAQFLKKSIRSRRLLIHDSTNREEILEQHMSSEKPTILLSPSMTEGVDLVGDASRFQVVCKVPYPYLGDKLTKKRMTKWDWWYGTQTARTIVQAVGRSVRTMEDHAVTYILDEDWQGFYVKNKHVFPHEFREAVRD